MDRWIDHNRAMRILVAVSAFVVAYLVSWLVLVVLIADQADGAVFVLPWLVAAGAAWLAWPKTAERPPILSRQVLSWGAIGAFAGFVAGFIGPLILAPQANQGPLLGLFITAPLGGLVGALGAWWWFR